MWFKAMTLVFALAHIMLLIISPTMTRFLYAVLLVLYAQLFVAYISVVGSSWKYRSQIPLPVSILMVATGVSIMISFVVFNLAEDDLSAVALVTAVIAWLGLGFAYLWMLYMSPPQSTAVSTPAAFVKVARTLSGL